MSKKKFLQCHFHPRQQLKSLETTWKIKWRKEKSQSRLVGLSWLLPTHTQTWTIWQKCAQFYNTIQLFNAISFLGCLSPFYDWSCKMPRNKIVDKLENNILCSKRLRLVVEDLIWSSRLSKKWFNNTVQNLVSPYFKAGHSSKIPLFI